MEPSGALFHNTHSIIFNMCMVYKLLACETVLLAKDTRTQEIKMQGSPWLWQRTEYSIVHYVKETESQ